mmetsp:Transcript_75937/g.203433  ORF Transcript_75937/g.203433 Transcript_75937/m.203433 type:complete len:705 (+) Transcript_75937:3-2117(+)
MHKARKQRGGDPLAIPLLDKDKDIELGLRPQRTASHDAGNERQEGEIYIKDEEQDYASDTGIRSRRPHKPAQGAAVRARIYPADGPDNKGLHPRPRQGTKKMAKMESQRERKARKKHVARSQQVLDQVELFRGRVSAVCSCMDLDTGKLLPALEQWQRERDGISAPPAGNSPPAEDSEGMSVKAKLLATAATGANMPSPVAGIAAGSDTIRGTWTFTMYTDVLHAQSKFEVEELMDAARAGRVTTKKAMEQPSGPGLSGPAGAERTSTDSPTAQLAASESRDASLRKGSEEDGGRLESKQDDAEPASPVPDGQGSHSPHQHAIRYARARAARAAGGADESDALPTTAGEETDEDFPRRRSRAAQHRARRYDVDDDEALAGDLEEEENLSRRKREGTPGVERRASGASRSRSRSTSSRRISTRPVERREEMEVGNLSDGGDEVYREAGVYIDDEAIQEEELRQAALKLADSSTKHVFFFQYGCLVFWGLEPEEERFFLDLVRPFEDDSIPDDDKEQDDMTFYFGSTTRLYSDEVCLATTDPLEKLSISFAIAQSTKLSVLESNVEETFESTRVYPQELADTGQISLSQTEVSKMIGQLFIVRSSVNLESDMLSTPDFFWENDKWEPIYRHASKYLEIDNRVSVLNKRLEVLAGMLEMLKDQLEVRHATRLEWIIIWLIVAEVGLQVVWNILIHDILGFFNHGGEG